LSLFDVLFRKRNTAAVAKDRLSIVLAHQRSADGPDFMSALKEELIQVIAKYAPVDRAGLDVKVERHGNIDVLKVDVVLPEDYPAGTA
jgi:cell division topological specificity factor